MNTIKALGLACLIALSFVAKTSAQPVQMLVRGGILCNTQEQLETLLTGISLAGGTETPAVEGCGQFVPEQPVPMTVTPLEWYVTPLASSLIAEFHYLPNGWKNYGWVEYVMNPDYKPPDIQLGQAL